MPGSKTEQEERSALYGRRRCGSSRAVAFIALAWVAVTLITASLLPGLAVADLAVSQSSLEGQTAQPMRFTHYDRDDGLSQSAINKIVQDKAGFMWFATESGLNRFDGYEFSVLRRVRGNHDTLPNDFITDVAIDSAGDLWITTDGGGLVRRSANPIELTVYRNAAGKAGSLPDDQLRRVLTDSRGGVWVGTMRSGLARLDTQSTEVVIYNHDPYDPASLSDDRVYALWLDADGTLWVGTGEGLDRLDPERGTVRRYSVGADGADNRILSIRSDSSGALWVGTAQSGLVRINDVTGEAEAFRYDESNPHALGSDRVEVIHEDSAGRLWIGTNNGLHLMSADRRSFTRYRHDPTDASSLSDSYVISIVEDDSGVLWVGTKTGGINKWNSRSWLLGHFRPEVTDESANKTPKVTSFTRDLEGRLWVGTFGSGILVLDEEMRRVGHIRKSSSGGTLSDDVVMTLATDTGGQIWAGTMHGGLNRIDPRSEEIRTYRHDSADARSLAADGIMSLYVARDGTVWIGTFGGGVSRYDRDADDFTNFSHDPAVPDSLSNPNATAITEDTSGTIWVATSGGGLNRMNPAGNGWQHYLHDPQDSASLSGSAVYSLHVDRRGDLWAGTRAGLNRLVAGADGESGGKFRTFAQSDGLANDVIYGILSAADGRLWLSTNYGISRYDPATGEVRNYHISDGLQSEEFNFGAYFADADGILYFGGNNGFNAFDPSALEFKADSPALVLTGIRKFNEPAYGNVAYDFLTEIELDYTDDMVSFEFAALEYTAPERNRYAYKLEGFDRDWVNAGTARTATYTDLPGGNYVFRVRGANSDGVWSDSDVEIAVGVEYPPWLRPSAFALYAMLAIGGIYLLYRVQARKLEREAEYSRRLELEVRDRTGDLAKSNADLLDANDRLREASLTDALTGLRNRRFLFEEVLKDVELVHRKHDARQPETDDNRDMTFLMVDLDHFKPINDSCGHIAGDRVLLQIRDALKRVCRGSDIIIRWGGDEFLIVGRESTHDEASTLAERVRAEIANTVFAVGNGQVARTTCSIGFASYPFIQDAPELLDWEQVLGVADLAMYRAKVERNAWVGVHGENWGRSGDFLYQGLQSNIEGLVQEGHVRIERSVALEKSKTA